ncbi:hypothetical protein ACOQNK_14780 [Acinetobacter baumannii]|uniref:hypothetical protein n=1 Tax=Acinetobacter baumannii TaxID=470 RepID=UPI003BAB9D45
MLIINFFNTINLLKKYYEDISKVGINLSVVGFLTYLNGIIQVTISKFYSTEMVVATGLATLLISFIISPLMVILYANQALFARDFGISDKFKDERKNICISSAIVFSLLVGFIFFLLFDLLSDAILYFLPEQSFKISHLINSYIDIVKYSILIVPLYFSLRGIFNGLGHSRYTLIMCGFETTIAFIILASIFLYTSILGHHLSEKNIIALLSFTIIFSELIGVFVGLFILFHFKILNFKFLFFFKQFKVYLSDTYNFFTFNALQNTIGFGVYMYFSNLVANVDSSLYSIYRLMTTIFSFNRFVVYGFRESNALFYAKKLYNKSLYEVKKQHTLITVLISFFSNLICFFVFLFLFRSEVFLYFNFLLPVAIEFVVIEPVMATLYMILIHCGCERVVSLFNIVVMSFYTLTLFFVKSYYYDFYLFYFSLTNLFVLMVGYIYIFKKNINSIK